MYLKYLDEEKVEKIYLKYLDEDEIRAEVWQFEMAPINAMGLNQMCTGMFWYDMLWYKGDECSMMSSTVMSSKFKDCRAVRRFVRFFCLTPSTKYKLSPQNHTLTNIQNMIQESLFDQHPNCDDKNHSLTNIQIMIQESLPDQHPGIIWAKNN